MTVNELYLVSRNARDKVQVVLTTLDQNGNTFVIKRITGQYNGKMTDQPLLVIEKGKAKRSVIEQANLEYNSIINKYLDKGYKKLSEFTNKSFSECTEPELLEFLGSHKTDMNGEKVAVLKFHKFGEP